MLEDPANGAPLNARSVVLSTLLGSDPPRMPVRRLLRVTALFGIGDGAVRTALTRMVERGEVVAEGDAWYRLSGPLLERQRRQAHGLAPAVDEWNGFWSVAVLTSGARRSRERAEFRRAMLALRYAEQREGVWIRPDNLDQLQLPESHQLMVGLSAMWRAHADRDDAALASDLWNLDGWADAAMRLRARMADLGPRLRDGDPEALAPGFVCSAAVLRHFLADPLLPRELTARRWPGAALRADYADFDRKYRRLLLEWISRR